MPALSITPKAESPIRSFSLPLAKEHDPARRPVAHGGFSDVYRLFSPTYGPVAVKRFRLNESERDALEKLINKEARVLTMINHPHIVPFLGIGYMDGAICIVTPWATNGSLASYLRRYPEANRLGLLVQVASALSYLHEYKGDIVIHGDLHVDNVLVSDTGSALLSDFGLSRIVPEGNSSSLYRGDSSDFRIGRVVYEAPELHDGEPRSWATDVFAFGMLIFHAYAGKQPFGFAHNYLTAVVALYGGQRPNRSEITRDDFSDDLWELVKSCWKHEAKQRPRMSWVYRRMVHMALGDCPSPSPHGLELGPTSPQNSLATGFNCRGAMPPVLPLSDAGPRVVDVRDVQPAPVTILYDPPIAIEPDELHAPAFAHRVAHEKGSVFNGFQDTVSNTHNGLDVASLLERGMLATAKPINRIDPPYEVIVAGQTQMFSADHKVGSSEKSPAPRKIKILFWVVLITCTATSAMYAFSAGALNNGRAVEAREPAADVAGPVAVLKAYSPRGSPLRFSDDAVPFTNLKRTSHLIPRWLEHLIVNAVNVRVVVSPESFPAEFVF